MGKKLNSSSKRKWIINGVLAFGAVALLTTGFATWIIGANNTKDDDNGTSVTVDTAQRNNVSLSVSLTDDDIYVGENLTDVTGSFINGKGEGEPATQEDTDFEISMDVDLEIGGDVTGMTKIDLSFAYDLVAPSGETNPYEGNVTDNNEVTVSSENANAWHTAQDYTYLDINEDKEAKGFEKDGILSLALPTEEGTPVNDLTVTIEEGTGNKKYTGTITLEIFTWGTFFGGKAPSSYYNELFDAGTITNSSDDVNAVHQELTNLHNAFNGGKIFIKAEVK